MPKDSSSAQLSKQITAPVTKAPEQTNQPLIVNKMVLLSPDRTPKDVGTWRDSHRAAESIYYPNRSRIYDLYKDVELDGHLSGIVEKRIKTILNKKIRFVKDGKTVEDVCDLTETIEFSNLCKEILWSIFWGISGFEFIPGEQFDFKVIPRKHIKPEKKVLTVNQTDYDGTSYEGVQNIWVVGEERDLGLYLKCSFYVMLKKGNFSDWANYIEIFGQPLVVTRYDAYDEKTKVQLNNAMESIGSSMRLSIPKQAEIDVLDGKTSNGNGDLQNKFKDACNEELSVIVVGNTETTKSSSSSGYAQSNTHSDQQDEIIKSDIKFLLNLLNSNHFKAILKSYGYSTDGKFTIEELMKPAAQKLRAETIKTLKDIGLPIKHEQLYEEFGLEKPDDYDAQMAQSQKEEEEQEQEPTANNNDLPTGTSKPKTKTKAKQQKQPTLSVMDRFFATLSDFFDQAHKD